MLDQPKVVPHILIVEDEEQLRNLFSYRLKATGYKVTTCGTVQEARPLLQQNNFNLVLLDLRLTDGSGQEVIQFMRENPSSPNAHTPILVVSGHIDTDLVAALRHQIEDSLAKPFDAKQLVERVRKVCRI